MVKETATFVSLFVSRVNGSAGRLVCKYKTVPDTAFPAMDYEHIEGEKIVFDHGEVRKEIRVKIYDNHSYSKKETFLVKLYDLEGPIKGVDFTGSTDATVVIVSDEGNP